MLSLAVLPISLSWPNTDLHEQLPALPPEAPTHSTSRRKILLPSLNTLPTNSSELANT